MTEKRFTVVQGYNDRYCQDLQTNELLNQNKTVECLNNLHEEKEYWKKRALLLENKYNEGDSIEWLRNNTVWEQMPTNRKTYTKNIYKD